jgi:hypothetical protein
MHAYKWNFIHKLYDMCIYVAIYLILIYLKNILNSFQYRDRNIIKGSATGSEREREKEEEDGEGEEEEEEEEESVEGRET